MKKVFYIVLGILLLIPNIIFASTTYDKGVDLANKYIYDYQDFSRYIKITGELPYSVSSSNRPVSNALFKTGGFLNEREYEMSIKNNSSYLAPGIGYWLVDRKILDVKAETFVNPNVESGVRVTEFTKHDVKVKGSGTKTNPWYFTDGYIVKVGSSDQTLGTVIGGCDHVQDGGSCAFTLSYDSIQGVNTDNCKSLVESKGGTLTQSGNTLTISNVHSDISCLVDFGVSNKCLEVSFDNADGTGGMDGKHIYFKYGYGWFSDALCLTNVTSVSRPTKSGNAFLGYKYNSITIINDTPSIAAGIRENIRQNITATAAWEPCGAGKYLNSSINKCVDCPANKYSINSANTSCADCPDGYATAGTGASSKAQCKITCTQDKYVATADTQCTNCAEGYHFDGTHTVSAGTTSPSCTGNTYYVHYNGNGATSGSMLNSEHVYGTASNLSANAFARTEYTFKGWGTTASGDVAYADNASVSTLTKEKNGVVELFALWRANEVWVPVTTYPPGVYAYQIITMRENSPISLGQQLIIEDDLGIYVLKYYKLNNSAAHSIYYWDQWRAYRLYNKGEYKVTKGTRKKYNTNGYQFKDPKGKVVNKTFYTYGDISKVKIEHKVVEP